MNRRRLFLRLLNSQRPITFRDFVSLIEGFGFYHKRTQGSHQIFEHPHLPELLSLQPRDGDAKPYQIRQFLRLVREYNLVLGDDE